MVTSFGLFFFSHSSCFSKTENEMKHLTWIIYIIRFFCQTCWLFNFSYLNLSLQTCFSMGVCNPHVTFMTLNHRTIVGHCSQKIVCWGLWVGMSFNLSCFNNTLVSHPLDGWKLWFQCCLKKCQMAATSYCKNQWKFGVYFVSFDGVCCSRMFSATWLL